MSRELDLETLKVGDVFMAENESTRNLHVVYAVKDGIVRSEVINGGYLIAFHVEDGSMLPEKRMAGGDLRITYVGELPPDLLDAIRGISGLSERQWRALDGQRVYDRAVEFMSRDPGHVPAPSRRP